MDELADDERVISGATEGPTKVVRDPSDCFDWFYWGEKKVAAVFYGEAEILARARMRYPELVAEVRELQAEVAMLRRHLERQGWKPLKEGDWQTLTKMTGGVRPRQEAP